MRIDRKAIIAASAILLGLVGSGIQGKVKPAAPKDAPTSGAPVLWREPADIASRDLFDGPGGKDHAPHGKFTFVAEDMAGTNPKFDVVDENGVKWVVKLGPEARPETAASRFVWAAGYFANEDYFVPVLHVENMHRLRRGRSLVSPEGDVRDVRLKRHSKDEKKVGTWAWSKDPFTGTREWYGLRVLMAVMNNWDLKDANNAVLRTRSEPVEDRYVVSDLGASFGPTGLDWMTKGHPNAYCSSKWVKSVSGDFVDFNVPSGPAASYYINFPELSRRIGLLWLGHHIPRQDARWMGDLLGRLSNAQIHDAFRAAGYSASEVEELSGTLEQRIAELKRL
jgi:hypothetical protein